MSAQENLPVMQTVIHKMIGKENYIDNNNDGVIVKRSETIGIILKSLRKREGWTQAQLAEWIGIAQQTYAGYENGKHEPSIEIMIRLAKHYAVTMDYITGRFMGDGTQRAIKEEEKMQKYLDVSLNHNKRSLQGEEEFIKMIYEGFSR